MINELKERLYYKEGFIYWKDGPRKGKVAGPTIDAYGYGKINFNFSFGKKTLKTSRVTWMILNGEIPEGMCIDHINHIRNDDRIENLRLVTISENSRNMSTPRTSKSGVMGVYWNEKRKKYHVFIKPNGKSMYFGSFSNIEDAIIVRKQKEKEYGFFKNHGSKNLNMY